MVEAKVFPVHLTAQCRLLLGLIADWHKTHGYAPTVREMCAAMGVASPSTVHAYLTILRDERAVDWVDRQNRTLHLTASGWAALDVL